MVNDKTFRDEYIGSYITGISHTQFWNEYIKKTCTEKIPNGVDSKGNTVYKTKKYDCSYVRDHPPSWKMTDNKGRRYAIDEFTYDSLSNLWQTPMIYGGMHRNYHTIDGNVIKYEWDEKPNHAVNITKRQSYENRIQASSNSIFKLGKITREERREYQLYAYPRITRLDRNGQTQQDAILNTTGIYIDDYYQNLFKFLNGYYGNTCQFRTYVMFFTNPDQLTSEKQRSYWKGGNKNELNICIGIDSLSMKVNWCNVFTWSDDRGLSIDIERLLEKQDTLDLQALYNLLYSEIPVQWKRKSFKDFEYLKIEISQTQLYIIIIILLIYNIIAAFHVVRNSSTPYNPYAIPEKSRNKKK